MTRKLGCLVCAVFWLCLFDHCWGQRTNSGDLQAQGDFSSRAATSRLSLIREAVRPGQRFRLGRAATEFSGIGRGSGSRAAHSGFTPKSKSGLPQPALRVTQSTGYAPSSTAVGDFNGDGKIDWAIAMAGDDSVWLYEGNGDGTWRLPTILALKGSIPTGIAAVDLRGSGKLDLIVAEAGSATVGVLLNNGDGTFQPEVEFKLPDAPLSIIAGDFNGDGKPDVVVGNSSGLTYGPVTTFLAGDGAGGLGAPVWNPNQPIGEAISLAAGDFNRDGKLDLVVVRGPSGTAYAGPRIFLGNGDGTFAEGQMLYADWPLRGNIAEAATVGDVDHDGCLDVVTFNADGQALFAKGSCDGTFQVPQSYYMDTAFAPLGDSIVSGFLADVNGDGNLDIVAGGDQVFEAGPFGENAGSLICVSFGDGQGHFSSHASVYRVGKNNLALAVADLKGDGRPDIVAPSFYASTLTVLRNDGKGGFGTPAGWSIFSPGDGAFLSQPAILDLNGDGKPDLALLKGRQQPGAGNGLAVFLGRPDGNLAPPVDSTISLNPDGNTLPGSIAFGDFRGTGKPDLVTLAFDDNNPSLHFSPNQGDGTFAPGSSVNTPGATGEIGVGDFNGDGKLDFVAAGAVKGVPQLTVFLGRGDGTFVAQPTVALPATSNYQLPHYIVVGDFNRDGKLDVLAHYASNGAGANLFRALGDGAGGFSSITRLFANFPDFTGADLNHDGCPDMVAGLSGVSRPGFAVYLCLPDGSFSAPTPYTPYTKEASKPYLNLAESYPGGPPTTVSSTGPLVGDFDGDGNLDVALFQSGFDGAGEMSFATGRGDGTFDLHLLERSIDESTAPQFAADVNGDGTADLLQFDTLTRALTSTPSTNQHATFAPVFRTLPVFSRTGHMRILLDQPASQAETFQLAISDPSLGLPSQVTVAKGATSVDVDFAIPGNFDYGKTFVVTATLGAETHEMLGYAIPGDYAAIEIQPPFLDFGSVDVGIQARPQTVTVTNFGSAPLTNIRPETYVVSDGCGRQIDAGTSCQIQVALTPVYAGPNNTSLLVVAGDTASAQIFEWIYGVPIATSATVSPATLSFSAGFGKTTAPQAATITNTGNQPLVFSQILTPLQFFTQTLNTCNQPVPPGGTCQVAYQFTAPQQPQIGPITYSVSFYGDLTGPLSLSLVATLSSGLAQADPTSLDFGTQPLGTTSKPLAATVTNVGSDPLYIAEIKQTPGTYGTTTCTNLTLAPHQTCSVSTSFAPAQAGPFSGAFTVVSTSTGGDLVIPVTGTGGGLGLSLASGSSNTITLLAGQISQQSVLVSESSSATVKLQCTAQALSCTLSPASIHGPANAGAVAVVFTASKPTSALKTGGASWIGIVLPMLGLLLPIGVNQRHRFQTLALLLVSVSLISCGGGAATKTPPNNVTPSGTYFATVTASDGTATASQNFTITVP